MIDEISERISDYCTKLKIDRKTISKYRIAAEESLSLWMDKFGENVEVELEFGKKFFSKFIKLKIKGSRYNPYDNKETENYGTAANDILLRVGLIPEFNYQNDTNVLVFNLKRKPMNQIIVLVGIILVSVLVGFCGKLILDDNIIVSLSNNLIKPVEDTFFNVLSSIAGPMIFLSVAWGIYGIGDVYTFGKIGKRLMLEFVKTIFVFVAIGALFYPLLGPAVSKVSAGSSQFSNIFNMFLSIFPSNIFSPFVEGNTLQIIFLAFIIGLSLIFLGQRTSAVARAVEQINHIINFLMEFVSKLVPFFVFVVLVNIIWSGTISAFKEVWRFTVIFLVAAIILGILFLLYVCLKNKQKPWEMFKAVLPSYLIAISTASSSATFDTNMKICNSKFGINKELSSFGIPFGMVIFKPVTALYYLLICFYFASVYSVPVSVSWIITAIVITVISAIATPPIPGGAAATYTILFTQLGINSKAIVMAIAVDMIFDFLTTSGNMFLLLLKMFNVSGKMGMRKSSVKYKNEL